MKTTPNTIVSTELQQQVVEAVQHSLNLIRASLPNEVFPVIEITYERAYSTAGWADYDLFRINFDPILLNANVQYFMQQIVPHEVAHLMAWFVFGTDIDPHGKEWKSVMVSMGIEPHTYHELDVSISKRITTEYKFACECKNGKRIHFFKSRMKKKLLLEDNLICIDCEMKFRPVDVKVPKGVPKKVAYGTKLDMARWVINKYRSEPKKVVLEKLVSLAGLTHNGALTYFHKIIVE